MQENHANDNKGLFPRHINNRTCWCINENERKLLLFYRSLNDEDKKYFLAFLLQYAQDCKRKRFKIVRPEHT